MRLLLLVAAALHGHCLTVPRRQLGQLSAAAAVAAAEAALAARAAAVRVDASIDRAAALAAMLAAASDTHSAFSARAVATCA